MKKKHLKTLGLLFLALFVISCSASRTDLSKSLVNTAIVAKADVPRTSILEIDSFNLEIISPSSGVQFYRDGIMFLSYSKYDEKMLSNHLSFGKAKAYFSNIYDGTLFKYSDFSPTMPFPFPCDAVTFSQDYKTMYFTKLSETDNKEKIYKAVFTTADNFQTGWSADGYPVSFCKDEYIFSHPALSSDEKTMIVASDKKDSYGGMDLYISVKEGNNWSELQSLGNTINSTANDFYPFLDNENNLYFSSDRKGGNGGYDIYLCKYTGKGWTKPVAITSRINSAEDDIAFTIDRKDGKSAFFTTKDQSGKFQPQLYRITTDGGSGKDENKNLTALLYEMTGAASEAAVIAYQTQREETQESTKAQTKETTPPSTVTQTDTKQASAAEKKQTAGTSATPSDKKTTTETAKTSVATSTPASVSKSTENKTESKTGASATEVVVYRVQILTTTQAKGSVNVTINNKIYKTYEYLYKGAYRTTIGEFSTFAPAVKLQNECRQSYPNAFVVAFRNNVRSTDPALFK